MQSLCLYISYDNEAQTFKKVFLLRRFLAHVERNFQIFLGASYKIFLNRLKDEVKCKFWNERGKDSESQSKACRFRAGF